MARTENPYLQELMDADLKCRLVANVVEAARDVDRAEGTVNNPMGYDLHAALLRLSQALAAYDAATKGGE